MRFFTKLYTLMLVILTVALAFTEYMVVSISIDNSFDDQVEANVKQHQLVKLAIQSGIMSVMRGADVDAATVTSVTEQTADSMNVELALYNMSGKTLIATEAISDDWYKGSRNQGYVDYYVVEEGDRYYLILQSTFTQNSFGMTLETVGDITNVYESADVLRNRCTVVILIAFCVCAVISLAFSVIITHPIKQLTHVSKAFSKGRYEVRATVFPRDEIGDLAKTFNNMADSIEDKISKLELAVRQREDFTAAFAHELKTPMTSIIGYADTLYQKNLPINEARDAAGFILNEGMRLEALSFKLMKLINITKSDFIFEETSMREFMIDVENTVRPLSARKRVPIEFHCDDGYVKIEMDLFKTMILNLIDNAFKSGGANVAVLGWVEGEYYRIAVVDNGRGIPKDELARVTEAFYMVDKARSRKENGAGLGLALCQRIADIHGTNLDIWSRVGQGTAVRLKLKLITDTYEEDDDE